MDRFGLNFVHAVQNDWETVPTKHVFESPIVSVGKSLINSFGNAFREFEGKSPSRQGRKIDPEGEWVITLLSPKP